MFCDVKDEISFLLTEINFSKSSSAKGYLRHSLSPFSHATLIKFFLIMEWSYH